MFVWIMPLPLAVPPTVTVFPPTSTRATASFSRVSVVRMASAKPAWPNSPAAARTPAEILPIGKRTPMTPVEATATSLAPIHSASAVSSCIARASSTPPCPVAALAMPLFATTARTPPPSTAPRVTTSGAPLTALRVNTAAASQGNSEKSNPRSLTPAAHTPHATPQAVKPDAAATPPVRDFIPIVESLFITGDHSRTRAGDRQPVYAET
jgi:hypothetical protein